MFFLCKKKVSLEDALAGAKKWIANNTVGGGITHSSKIRKPYPEVSGYYIPTLLKWGEIDRAKHYGDWLLSIQTQEGAWQNTDLNTIYTFFVENINILILIYIYILIISLEELAANQ